MTDVATRAAPARRRRPLEVDVRAVGVRPVLGAAYVERVVRAVLAAERAGAMHMSVTFLDERAMAAHNRRHLGHVGATDVITFELPGAGDAPRGGDVYIAPDVARRNARECGRGVREELTRLVVHGTLHALGWDHPEGTGRESSPMWRRQERLVAQIMTRATAPPTTARRTPRRP